MMPADVIRIDPARVSDMLSDTLVRHMMTKDPKTISVNAPLIEAASQMLEHRIGALPVMDGDKLMGIITESDIFRALVKQLQT
jgi:acetoin utilization protein AcuB